MRAIQVEGDDTCIAPARAVGLLTRVRAEHSLPVSQRAMDLPQLGVSELVTNARRYASGPVLLDLRIVGDAVEVWCGTAIRSCRWRGPPTRAGWASTFWRSSWPSPRASRSSGSRSASASPPASPFWTTPASPSPDPL